MCALFQQERRHEKTESRTDEQAFIHGLIFDFQQYRALLPETIRGGKIITQEETLLDSIEADLARAAKFKAVEVNEFKRLMSKQRTELGSVVVRGVFKPVIKELTENLLPRFIAEYTSFREEKERKSQKKETSIGAPSIPENQKERVFLIKKLQEILTDEQSRNTKRLPERGRFIFQTIINYTKNLSPNDEQSLERLLQYINEIASNEADMKALAHIANLVDQYQRTFTNVQALKQRHEKVNEALKKFTTFDPSEEPKPTITVETKKTLSDEERRAQIEEALNNLPGTETPRVTVEKRPYTYGEQLDRITTILRPGTPSLDAPNTDGELTSPRVALAPPPETLPVEPLPTEQIHPLAPEDADLDADLFNSAPLQPAPLEREKNPLPDESVREKLMSEESLERMLGAFDEQIDRPKPQKPLSQMTKEEQKLYAAAQEAGGFDDLMSELDIDPDKNPTPQKEQEKPKPYNRPTLPFSLETFPIRPRLLTLTNGSTAEYVGNFDSDNQYEGRGIFKITGTPYDRLVIAYFDHGKLRHPDSVSIQFEIQTNKGKTRVTSTGPADDNYLTHGSHCVADLISPADHAEFEGQIEHGIPTFGTITYLSTHEDPIHIYEGPTSPDFSPLPNQGTWKTPGSEGFRPEHTIHLTAEEAKELESLRPNELRTEELDETVELEREPTTIQQKLSDLVNNTRRLLLAKIEAEPENAQRIRDYELPILNTFNEIIFDPDTTTDEARFKELDVYRDTVEAYLHEHFEDPLTHYSEIFDLLGDIDTLIAQERTQQLKSRPTDKVPPVEPEKAPDRNEMDSTESIEVLKNQIDSKFPGLTDEIFAFVGELLLSYPQHISAEQGFLDIESILIFVNSIEYPEDLTAQGIAQVCHNISDYLKKSQADKLASTEFVSQVHKLLTQYLEPISENPSPEEAEPLPPLLDVEAEPVAPHPFEQEDRTITHGVPLPAKEALAEATFEGDIPPEILPPHQRTEAAITPPASQDPVIEEPDMLDPADDTYAPRPIHLHAEQGISVQTEPTPEKPGETDGPSIIIEDSGMIRGLQEGVLRAQEVANIERERTRNTEIQKTLEDKISTIFATANQQRGSRLPSLPVPSQEFFARFTANFLPTAPRLLAVATDLRSQYEQNLAAENITIADIHFAFETNPPLFALLPSTRAKERHRKLVLANAQAQQWYTLEVLLHHIKDISS